MKIFSILFFVLVVVSVCDAENLILSAATTDKKLILLNIEYKNKQYRVVDTATFNVPFQVGLTALGRLENGNNVVFWTAQDSSKKIKLHKMIFDKELNKIGNTKKFGRVLTSYYNLEFIEDTSLNPAGIRLNKTENPSLALDAQTEWVRFALRGTNGDSIEQPERIYKSPNGFDAFDSDVSVSSQGVFYYASLGYLPGTQQYAVFFGDIANSNFTSGFVFKGPIISEDLIPVYQKDKYNFVHVERLNNPVRYNIANRQFANGQPDGALIKLYTINSGDLGQLQFFNMITAVPSIEEPTGAHVFSIKLNASKDGTDLMVFRINTVTGKRNSGIRLFSEEELQQLYDGYIYALDITRGLETFE